MAGVTELNRPLPGRLQLSRLLQRVRLKHRRLKGVVDRPPPNHLLLNLPRLPQRLQDRVADVP